MSDDEEVYSEEEEEEEQEKEEEAPAPRSDEEVEKDAKKSDDENEESEDDAEDDKDKDVKKDDEEESAPPQRSAPAPSRGPSEAEIAMQKRKLGDIGGLDEESKALLAANAEERAAMEAEIRELRARNEQRKREREEEEKKQAERRAEEEARRKAEEEERRQKKTEEEAKKKADRAAKMEQFEKLKNPPKPNFVISKRGDGSVGVTGEGEEEEAGEKKSKEQLEAEKKAILSQRIPEKPDVGNMNEGKLQEKAKELFKELCRLEAEKYDLEKRFKEQQRDMMELAERARSINKVGKGGLKRMQLDEEDQMASKFAGIPAKIQMYSKYERQKDKRNFSERHVVFHGPTWKFPAERVRPTRNVKFNPDTGLPEYEDLEGAEAEQPQEAEAAAEGEE